jgi:hypothetical protein
MEPPWADLHRLLAAADVVGERRWKHAALAVFEHAADWDVYGRMQAIRHGPERAFLDDADGVAAFATGLEALMVHPRAGTRLWVTRELGILRRLSSVDALLAAVDDPNAAVASEAVASLEMLAQDHPEARAALHARGN